MGRRRRRRPTGESLNEGSDAGRWREILETHASKGGARGRGVGTRGRGLGTRGRGVGARGRDVGGRSGGGVLRVLRQHRRGRRSSEWTPIRFSRHQFEDDEIEENDDYGRHGRILS